MAIFDLLDLFSVADLITWRIFIPTAIGVGAGAAVFYASGESTAAAPVAFGLMLFGFVTGLVWEYCRESGKGRRRRR